MIKLKGIEIKGIRIYEDINKYGDTTNLDIISNNTFTGVLDYSNIEIPINRYRLDNTDATIDNESIYLFDILPLDLFTRWSDELEKGDLLVLLLKDKVANIDIPIVFRISETLGRFQTTLLWKKYQVAPYNPGKIDSSVKTLILDYITNN